MGGRPSTWNTAPPTDPGSQQENFRLSIMTLLHNLYICTHAEFVFTHTYTHTHTHTHTPGSHFLSKISRNFGKRDECRVDLAGPTRPGPEARACAGVEDTLLSRNLPTRPWLIPTDRRAGNRTVSQRTEWCNHSSMDCCVSIDLRRVVPSCFRVTHDWISGMRPFLFYP